MLSEADSWFLPALEGYTIYICLPKEKDSNNASHFSIRQQTQVIWYGKIS